MQIGASSIQYVAKRPEVELRTRPRKWVEFVVGSRLAPTVSICVLRFLFSVHESQLSTSIWNPRVKSFPVLKLFSVPPRNEVHLELLSMFSFYCLTYCKNLVNEDSIAPPGK